ncbi:MAG: prolyl-tRNA synthetase [Kiritimatiellia bacterium]|jgi:prolyl-tRNA synthetase
MRMSRLVGRQIKEAPKDASTVSHVFMMRGGYVRPVSAGVYSLLPLGQRVLAKIERIIRQEMDRIDGQEVLMPVVLPKQLWDESGRYSTVGPELLRFTDRNDKHMLLGMTHEEAAVHMVRTEVSSYKQLPAVIYQIQTKYRDEARPRAGLIRVREFTMKDAYSFHADTECLGRFYQTCHQAYERMFARMGLGDVLSFESDTGMMGGQRAHEFMALADCGEDTLFLSPDRSYRANKEVATTGLRFDSSDAKPLEKVHTPNEKTIAQVAAFLNVSAEQTGKAVFYQDSDGGLIFAVIRGDLEVNEAKLRKVVGGVFELATDAQIEAIGAVAGYASPLGIDPSTCRVIFDPSAAHSANLVVGANEVDYHYLNFNFERDMAGLDVEIVDIATARAGDPCPLTGEPLQERRGIEVGNIFQLGTRYSGAMGCTFLNNSGRSETMVMGSYGIGVGRAAACVIEAHHDDNGPIWPISVAPFEVHIVGINHKKQPVRETCEVLYDAMRALDIEVLYDDRGKRGGFAFADADLVGAPFRLVVAPRGLAEGSVELKSRDGTVDEQLAPEAVVARLQVLLSQAYAALNSFGSAPNEAQRP